MSDLDVRSYERVLERNGHDPRAVGARLLGVDPARLLLLARPGSPPPGSSLEPVPTDDRRWRKVTGVHLETRWTGPTGEAPALPFPEGHHALWALPFVTFEELLAASGALTARTELVVWDASPPARVVEWFGRASLPWSYDRLDEGWRDPRDSGESTAALVAEHMRDMRSRNVIVHDALDDVRFEPVTLTGMTVRGVTAAVVPAYTSIRVYVDQDSELTVEPGTGRAFVGLGRNWRTHPPGWDWTRPLRVVADVATQGGLGRSFGVGWNTALTGPSAPLAEIYGYLERSETMRGLAERFSMDAALEAVNGPRCSFCDCRDPRGRRFVRVPAVRELRRPAPGLALPGADGLARLAPEPRRERGAGRHGDEAFGHLVAHDHDD